MAERTRRRRRTPPAAAGPSTPVRAPKALGFYGFTVRDVMTRSVVTVGANEPLETAGRRMVEARVSGLPVTGADGALVGVISQKDIFRRLTEDVGLTLPRGLFDLLLPSPRDGRTDTAEACRRVLRGVSVRRAMTKPAVTIPPTTTLDDAVGILLTRRINRLPVVDGGRLVGIVTRHDLLTGVGTAP